MRWSALFIASNEPGAPEPSAPVRALNWLLVGLGFSLLFYFSFHQLAIELRWKSIAPYRQMFLDGWLTTVAVSAASLVLSLLLGLALALLRRSPVLVWRYFARVYIEVVRGTPLLAQILILYYVVAAAFHLDNLYVAGVLILSGFSAAYIAEIIRAGIESVARSQLESAQAIGLTRRQIYRYVIFPQALRQALPPLAGQFASLIKDSSLLYVMGLPEFTANAQTVNAITYNAMESYIPLALGYLVLTLPISLWSRRLEAQHKFET